MRTRIACGRHDQPSAPRGVRSPRRHGVAVIGVVIFMLMANLAVLGLVLGGARDQELAVRQIESARALYAAEAGLSLAIRELAINSDEDGDGVVGSISNDGNAANDPALGTANFYVAASAAGGQTTVVSRGRCGLAQRKLSSVLD